MSYTIKKINTVFWQVQHKMLSVTASDFFRVACNVWLIDGAMTVKEMVMVIKIAKYGHDSLSDAIIDKAQRDRSRYMLRTTMDSNKTYDIMESLSATTSNYIWEYIVPTCSPAGSSDIGTVTIGVDVVKTFYDAAQEEVNDYLDYKSKSTPPNYSSKSKILNLTSISVTPVGRLFLGDVMIGT